MNPLYYELFDKLSQEIPELTETENRIVEQVNTLLEQLKKDFPPEQFEKIGETAFLIVTIAEREGFVLGLNYMAHLINR
jgi:hypothetical protein